MLPKTLNYKFLSQINLQCDPYYLLNFPFFHTFYPPCYENKGRMRGNAREKCKELGLALCSKVSCWLFYLFSFVSSLETSPSQTMY